jgi:hypothetical protein
MRWQVSSTFDLDHVGAVYLSFVLRVSQLTVVDNKVRTRVCDDKTFGASPLNNYS